MASRKLDSKDLDQVHKLAKHWGKIVVRQAFGEKGPGLDVDLDMMEAVAMAAARGLTEGTLEEATGVQSAAMDDTQPRLPAPSAASHVVPNRTSRREPLW